MKYTIFWSKSAVRDLQRARDFLKNISPNAANNAATQINQYTQKLAMFPLAGKPVEMLEGYYDLFIPCLLYTSPSPRDLSTSRMPSSA